MQNTRASACQILTAQNFRLAKPWKITFSKTIDPPSRESIKSSIVAVAAKTATAKLIYRKRFAKDAKRGPGRDRLQPRKEARNLVKGDRSIG